MDDHRQHSRLTPEQIREISINDAIRRRETPRRRPFDGGNLLIILVLSAFGALALWGLTGHSLYGDGECWANCESTEVGSEPVR